MKYRRVKVLFYTTGGRGPRTWRQPHERYAWVPVDNVQWNARVTLLWPDLDRGQPFNCTIVDIDTLVIDGELLSQCIDIPVPAEA